MWNYFYIVIAIIFVVYVLFKPLFNKDQEKVKAVEKLPYKLTDSFLSDAEKSFYHALKLYVGDKFVICPKVGLKDIFSIGKGVGKNYTKYKNKIAQKHVDFILCETDTMNPICGIELDDSSHTSKKGYERDLFVEEVYKVAGLELIRFSSKSGYTNSEFETNLFNVMNREVGVKKEAKFNITDNNGEVLCPKCEVPMIRRKATKGQDAGKEFLGCVNYPKCKEVKELV